MLLRYLPHDSRYLNLFASQQTDFQRWITLMSEVQVDIANESSLCKLYICSFGVLDVWAKNIPFVKIKRRIAIHCLTRMIHLKLHSWLSVKIWDALLTTLLYFFFYLYCLIFTVLTILFTVSESVSSGGEKILFEQRFWITLRIMLSY